MVFWFCRCLWERQDGLPLHIPIPQYFSLDSDIICGDIRTHTTDTCGQSGFSPKKTASELNGVTTGASTEPSKLPEGGTGGT